MKSQALLWAIKSKLEGFVQRRKKDYKKLIIRKFLTIGCTQGRRFAGTSNALFTILLNREFYHLSSSVR